MTAGDHVIPLYIAECRTMPVLPVSRKTNLCTAIRATQGKGVMPDGTSRFSFGGETIAHYMGCSTFSNFTVMPEIALAKVREDAPFDKICYIGCGVTTGIGAAIWTAGVEPGATVAVFGLGGIGLNVIQGARMAGAVQIVGVDINPAKRAMAERFGMTDFINPDEVGRDKVVQAVVDATKGGADYTFDCTGNTDVMRQALESAHRGWGTSVVIGVAESGQGDRDPAVPADHRPDLEGHRLRRRARAHRRAEDRRLVHGRQDRDRPADHPHHAARRHQQGLRPDARRREHPRAWCSTDAPEPSLAVLLARAPARRRSSHERRVAVADRHSDPDHHPALSSCSTSAPGRTEGAMTLETVSTNKSHGGVQGVYRHASRETGTDMTFSVFVPPQAEAGAKLPGRLVSVRPHLHPRQRHRERRVSRAPAPSSA